MASAVALGPGAGESTIKFRVRNTLLVGLDSSMVSGRDPEAASGPAGNLARRLDGWTRRAKTGSMMPLRANVKDNKDGVEIASLAAARNSAPRLSYSLYLALRLSECRKHVCLDDFRELFLPRVLSFRDHRWLEKIWFFVRRLNNLVKS